MTIKSISFIFVLFALIQPAHAAEKVISNAKMPIDTSQTKLMFRFGALVPNIALSTGTNDDSTAFNNAEAFTARISTGVGIQLPLNSTFSIEPGLHFSQKGTYTSIEQAGIGSAKTSIKANYLELPVLLNTHLSIAKTQQLVFSIGPSIGFMVGNSISQKFCLNGQACEESSGTISSENINRFEFSGIAGLGYQIQVSDSIALGIDSRYQMGFTDLDADPKTTTRNTGFSALASLGVSI